LEHLDFRYFVEEVPSPKKELRTETDHSELSIKFERAKALSSLRQTEITPTRASKRTNATGHGNKIHQNLSENSIPTFSTESRKVKVPPKIAKSIVDFKP
jgi:hypothetical protein